MTPWYARRAPPARRPPGRDGGRPGGGLAGLGPAAPRWTPPPTGPARARGPAWVRRLAPWLGRFWGEGLTQVRRAGINEEVFDWARDRPDGLRAAARAARRRRRSTRRRPRPAHGSRGSAGIDDPPSTRGGRTAPRRLLRGCGPRGPGRGRRDPDRPARRRPHRAARRARYTDPDDDRRLPRPRPRRPPSSHTAESIEPLGVGQDPLGAVGSAGGPTTARASDDASASDGDRGGLPEGGRGAEPGRAGRWPAR